METIIYIKEEFITLGQFLKHANIIQSGGMARPYLETYPIFVDGELENRRGKKLYSGTIVEIPEEGKFIVQTALDNEPEI
ncbi:S4 domain-containing protein YaaA [Lacticigenium naphthae]|uniref:S4 domain-containing protein YaaA n=1 Tax=Lacticigenium naphthae TaxID=515351 RepID=UPI000415F721|nr:S4 domain-containing protein YaaA [Lacticigenium naphthae]